MLLMYVTYDVQFFNKFGSIKETLSLRWNKRQP